MRGKTTAMKVLLAHRAMPGSISVYQPNPDRNQEASPSLYQRYKTFFKHYGLVGIATYWGLWGGVFGGFYLSFKTGLMDYEAWRWLNMDKLEGYYFRGLEWVGMDPTDHPVTPKTKDILVAAAAAKVLKPLEFLTALAITPPLARSLGLAPPPKKTMGQRLEETKEKLFKAKTSKRSVEEPR
jgi:hypothetical protein